MPDTFRPCLPPCPHCRAPRGEPCRIASGKKRRPHKRRFALAGQGRDWLVGWSSGARCDMERLARLMSRGHEYPVRFMAGYAEGCAALRREAVRIGIYDEKES